MKRTLRASGVLALAACHALAQSPPTTPAPGELVMVGEHRLHIRCAGPRSAAPTVIFEAGGGASSASWAKVQDALGARVRSCAYDRAALGWSEPGPAPRTFRQETYELAELLRAAKVSPPYVLVGHSIGGLLVRSYTQQHDRDVVGVVLVDPAHEDEVLYSLAVGRWVRLRDLSTGRTVPEPKRTGAASTKYDPAEDFMAEEFELIRNARIANAVPFGERPLIVIGAGVRPAPPGTSDTLWSRMRVEKDGHRIDLSRLSRNAKFILDPASTHNIPGDNPQIIARAIEEVVAAAVRGTRLVP